jgi:Bacteriophage Sf6, terminase small subunit-like
MILVPMPTAKELAANHRPSEYTPEMGSAICDRIAEGESLAKICSDPSMPTRGTVRRWCAEHEDFRQHYESAEDFALDVLPDEAVDIADDCRPTVSEKVSRGRVVRVRDPEEFHRRRLRVEVRWWVVEQKRISKP